MTFYIFLLDLDHFLYRTLLMAIFMDLASPTKLKEQYTHIYIFFLYYHTSS